MVRKANKIKANAEVVRISVILDADIARAIDAEAEAMRREDPFKRAITRTDAFKVILRDGLAARAKMRKGGK